MRRARDHTQRAVAPATYSFGGNPEHPAEAGDGHGPSHTVHEHRSTLPMLAEIAAVGSRVASITTRPPHEPNGNQRSIVAVRRTCRARK